MTFTTNNTTLQDACYELSLRKRIPDADLLDEFVKHYPQFSTELTDFAISLALDALDPMGDVEESIKDSKKVTPAVSRAMSHFHNLLHTFQQEKSEPAPEVKSVQNADKEPTNPFKNLNRQEFREFAKRLNVNLVFVTKLRDRQIDPSSMSNGFIELIANDLPIHKDVLVAHLVGAQSAAPIARQFHKSDEKPSNSQQESFTKAVKNSGLSDEQQKQLLRL